MRLLAAAVALLLSGCQLGGTRAAVAAQCNSICYQRCVGEDGDTGVRWTAAPDAAGAFDELGESVVNHLADKLRTCDARRDACVQCINRLDKRGVIVR